MDQTPGTAPLPDRAKLLEAAIPLAPGSCLFIFMILMTRKQLCNDNLRFLLIASPVVTVAGLAMKSIVFVLQHYHYITNVHQKLYEFLYDMSLSFAPAVCLCFSIDRLIAVVYTKAYSNASTCIPYLAILLSGFSILYAGIISAMCHIWATPKIWICVIKSIVLTVALALFFKVHSMTDRAYEVAKVKDKNRCLEERYATTVNLRSSRALRCLVGFQFGTGILSILLEGFWFNSENIPNQRLDWMNLFFNVQVFVHMVITVNGYHSLRKQLMSALRLRGATVVAVLNGLGERLVFNGEEEEAIRRAYQREVW